jgi:hypothetical protein
MVEVIDEQNHPDIDTGNSDFGDDHNHRHDHRDPHHPRPPECVCFMPGTRILTPSGEVAVEDLKPGDLVLMTDGPAAPVRWVGRQTVLNAFADEEALPVRVRAGAIDLNVPSRDLLVSHQHALLVDGILVQAGALINGTAILRERDTPDKFVYYHVELEQHSLILAENTPAETFVDCVDRARFDNWEEYKSLYPNGKSVEEMPLPRAKSARQVPAATRVRLARRAAEILSADAATAA